MDPGVYFCSVSMFVINSKQSKSLQWVSSKILGQDVSVRLYVLFLDSSGNTVVQKKLRQVVSVFLFGFSFPPFFLNILLSFYFVLM